MSLEQLVLILALVYMLVGLLILVALAVSLFVIYQKANRFIDTASQNFKNISTKVIPAVTILSVITTTIARLTGRQKPD